MVIHSDNSRSCRWCGRHQAGDQYADVKDRKGKITHAVFCKTCVAKGCLDKLHKDDPVLDACREEQQQKVDSLFPELKKSKSWFSV